MIKFSPEFLHRLPYNCRESLDYDVSGPTKILCSVFGYGFVDCGILAAYGYARSSRVSSYSWPTPEQPDDSSGQQFYRACQSQASQGRAQGHELRGPEPVKGQITAISDVMAH